MPQMQHASSKSSILTTHAGAQKTNDEIGIFQTPTDKGIIEAVDAIEIAARHSQVAGLRAVPTCGASPCARMAVVSSRDNKMRLPVTNQPGS